MRLTPLNDLPLLKKAAELADAAGLELYAVGGCARDWALGQVSADIDFLLSGGAAAVVEGLEKEYGGRHEKFGPFLTVRYFSAEGRRLDFAGFRKETYSAPAALPAVSQAACAAEDLKRRDFACNAMCVSLNGPEKYSLLDPYGGLADIKAGLVRVLHEKSFQDDPTRLFRAARFAGRFGWRLDDGTRELAQAAVKAGLPGLLSRQRLRNELVKILSEADPLPPLDLLKALDALQFLHPAFAFGPELRAPGTARERLARIAALMGPDGAGFLEGLKFSKSETAALAVLAGTFKK
jgi:tRNA nucleotidyltransferase (CCA-adding enzyme)